MILTREQLRRLVLQEMERLVHETGPGRSGDPDDPRLPDLPPDLLLNDPVSEDEILPVHGRDGYLERNIESVTRQLNEIQDRSNLLLGSLETDRDADEIADNVRKAHILLNDAQGILEGNNE